MAENPHLWSDYDSNSSRLGSAASFFGDSMSHSSGILTENSSLFSMSEDDFDQLATLKAREMFDEVDRILYENSENGSLEITKECQEWKSKFPHLRIVGHKMFESIDHGFRRYSPADVMFNDANSNMSSMLDQCSDFSNLLNGLSIKGERMNARQFDSNFHAGGGQVVASEEVIDHDGDYEEIFALDYNSDERRSMYGSSRGYPPITPINSLRDFIVSTLSNKLLADVSPHVVDLVRQCKTRQTSIGDERSRDKENVKMDERSNASTPRIVLLPSPLKTRNEEFLFASHHVNSRSFSFKPSDLQVVPEDSGLGAILTVRQMRSSREVSPLSPSMHNHHLDHKTSGRTEKSKSLFPSNGMDSSPRMSKADSGKTFSSNHRIDVWKQQLPRIQQKPLTASNNNINGTKPKNCTPQGLRTKDRVKSLTSVDRKSRQSFVNLSESLTSISRVKHKSDGIATKNFIQENIRNISSRKGSKSQDSVVSCQRAPRNVNVKKEGNEMPSVADVVENKNGCVTLLKTKKESFGCEDSQHPKFKGSNLKVERKETIKVTKQNVEELKTNDRFDVRNDAIGLSNDLKSINESAIESCNNLRSTCRCLGQICEVLKEICSLLRHGIEQTPQRASSALHSGRDQFSARQHLGFSSRFGDKLGYKFDYGRPSSTQTYYNNKVESRLGIQSPAVSSSRIILPELEERNRLHSSDPSNKCQLSRRKTNLSSTMPQIHDTHAGRRRGTLPSKSRPNLVPFR